VSDLASGARLQVRRAVTAMTGGLGDPRSAVHDPLAAITAATALGHAATAAIRDHARTAREDGRTWAQIGEAMGFRPDPRAGIDAPYIAWKAFGAVASDLGSGQNSFAWTCPSCLRLIADYGPEAGSPADAEHGHAEGCARLAETVRAYDASWEDGGDE